MTPMSHEGMALLKLLADGRWWPFEEVMVKLGEQIAPGKALRRYEVRAANRMLTRGPRVGPELSDEDKIASGRRTLANVTINSLKKRYIDVRRDDNGSRFLRLREGAAAPPSMPPGSSAEPVSVAEDAEPAQERQEPERPRRRKAEDPYTCERCGLWVVNVQQHQTFHEEYDQPAQGVPQGQFRQLIREECGRAVASALSGFTVATEYTPEDVQAVKTLVRSEVGDVIAGALDSFQKGFQTWLGTQLNELARNYAMSLNRQLRNSPLGIPWHQGQGQTDRRA